MRLGSMFHTAFDTSREETTNYTRVRKSWITTNVVQTSSKSRTRRVDCTAKFVNTKMPPDLGWHFVCLLNVTENVQPVAGGDCDRETCETIEHSAMTRYAVAPVFYLQLSLNITVREIA